MNILRRSRLALLLLAAAGATFGAFANTDATTPPPAPAQQGPKHPGRHFDPERRLAKLTEKLGLTAEQQTSIRAIFTAEAETIKRLDSEALTGDQRREKMHQIRRGHRAKVSAVLTQEQRTKFAEMHPKGPRHPKAAHAGTPPPPPENAK